MIDTGVPLLIVSGPVGVGKTRIGQEVSTILHRQRIAHSFVDLDGLAATYPRPADDPFGTALAVKNLRAVWENAARAGARNLILSRVIEVAAERAAIEGAVPGCRSTVCLLRASRDTLRRRVQMREVGAGRDWHMKRAMELAGTMAHAPSDFEVDTDGRDPADIAQELAARVDRA